MTNEKRILELTATPETVSDYQNYLEKQPRYRTVHDCNTYGYLEFTGPTGIKTIISLEITIGSTWDTTYKTHMLDVIARARNREGEWMTTLLNTLYGVNAWEFGVDKIKAKIMKDYEADKRTRLQATRDSYYESYDRDPMVKFGQEIMGEEFEGQWFVERNKPEFKDIKIVFLGGDRGEYIDQLMSERGIKYRSPSIEIEITYAHSGNSIRAHIRYEGGNFIFKQFGTWKEIRYKNTDTLKKRIFEKIHELEAQVKMSNSVAKINSSRHALLIKDGWSVKEIVQLNVRHRGQESPFQCKRRFFGTEYIMTPVWLRDEKYKTYGVKGYRIKGLNFVFSYNNIQQVIDAIDRYSLKD